MYDRRLLEILVEVVGEDNVLLGSDYPVGDRDPVGFIEGCNVRPEAREKILWRNAERVLGVSARAA